MSNKFKTYFLVRGWDIPASALQLGNLIANPTEPHLAILGYQAPDRPSGATSVNVNGFHIDTPVFTNTKTDFSLTINKQASNKFGIFAQFLQVFGFGAEAGFQISTDTGDTFTFESEYEEWFSPSMQFLEQAVAQPAVQMFLAASSSRTPLYVITGLRTVKGITAGSTIAKDKKISGQMSLDATGTGVPVSVGPTIEHTRGRGEEIKWKCDGPLVFAYRLSRIKPNKADWATKSKSYTKGAFFGIEQRQDKMDLGIDDAFLNDLEDVEVQAVSDFVDGEDCIVVIPTNC